MLFLGIVQEQAKLHALARQLAIRQRTHAGQDCREPGFSVIGHNRCACCAICAPVSDHLFEIGDQKL